MSTKNPLFHRVIFLLIFLMSGLNGLAASVFAAASDTIVPIIRHRPPDLLFQGNTVVIEAIVEGGNEMRSVILWHRIPGKERFQKILMNATSRRSYEGGLTVSKKDQSGIEYYIEAVDAFGNQGQDGSSAKPYFLAISPPLSFSFSNEFPEEGASIEKPFWKKPWFWAGVVAVIGGGIAAAGSGGGNGGDRGTVVVE